MNLNQVTLPVHDLAPAIEFYRALGLRLIVHSPPRYARFECPDGGATFSLHRVETAPVATGVVVYFECAELDATVARLQADGLVFRQLPVDERWLWREARLSDPSGNEVCLYWAGTNRRHPPWRLPD